MPEKVVCSIWIGGGGSACRGFINPKFGKVVSGIVAQHVQMCVEFLENEGRCVCCVSHWILVCVSNLSWWLCWEKGWQRWLLRRYM